jgi:hypothetical protein
MTDLLPTLLFSGLACEQVGPCLSMFREQQGHLPGVGK